MRDPESANVDGAIPSSEAKAPVHFAGLILVWTPARWRARLARRSN
jgi:hypothetical protein